MCAVQCSEFSTDTFSQNCTLNSVASSELLLASLCEDDPPVIPGAGAAAGPGVVCVCWFVRVCVCVCVCVCVQPVCRQKYTSSL